VKTSLPFTLRVLERNSRIRFSGNGVISVELYEE
jgi:hypothetical protein